MAGAFWGGFAGGLSHGLTQGMELQLKKKMIDAQIKHLDAQNELEKLKADQTRQLDLEGSKLGDMMTGGVAQPALLEPGQEGPSPASNFQFPAGAQVTPGGPSRPASQQELSAQAIKATPPAQRYHLLGATGAGAGGDMQSELAKYEAMFPGITKGNHPTFTLRMTQGVNGVIRPAIAPRPDHGPAMTMFNNAKRVGASDDEAAAIVQKFVGGQSASRAFGNIEGQVNAQQGVPLSTPIVPGQPAMTGQPANKPKSIYDMTLGELMGPGYSVPPDQGQPAANPVPIKPAPNLPNMQNQPSLTNPGGPRPIAPGYPQPSPSATVPPGVSRFNQQQGINAGVKEGAKLQAEQDHPLPPGKESRVVRVRNGKVEFAPVGTIPSQWGGREVPQETVHGLTALEPAQAALEEFNKAADDLIKQNKGIAGRLSSVTGTTSKEPGMLQGFGAGIAQDYGASKAGDTMQATKGFLMQHYESMFAGVRGASGAQIQQLLESRAPQPGMNPDMIVRRKTYMNNVFNALKGALLRVANGSSPEEVKTEVDAAIQVDPDKLIPPPPKGYRRVGR